MKTKVLTIQLLIMFLTSVLIAQDSKSIIEKLEKIKGDASKIVITTDKENIVFEGDEAKTLLKKLKSKKVNKRIEWISEDGHDIDGEDVMIFKSDGGKKHIIKHKGHGNKMMKFMDYDMDIIDGKKIIKVNVEDDPSADGGKKKVTVTTKEDGEEKVETYEGKEADEYLEKMKAEHEIIIDFDIDSDDNHVWINKGDSDGKKIEKKVDVKVEDGVKKVTVKTTKDGKETIKTYEGDEADNYLENMPDKKHCIKIKDGKKCKKVIIKEIEEEEK